MSTDQPAAVSTSAAVAPAGPVPMTSASHSRSALLTAGDLLVGVAARLHVAGEPDRGPAAQLAVAQVLGRGIRALDDVLVEQTTEVLEAVEAGVLLLGPERREICAERGDSGAVPVLPPDDRTQPFTLGDVA